MEDELTAETSSIIKEESTSAEVDLDISKTSERFCMLFYACFLCFGAYFVYDSPAPLQKELESVRIK